MRKHTDPKVAELTSVDFFAGCSHKELAQLSSVLTEATIRPGTVLIHEDQHEPEECMLILEGDAVVARNGVELATLGRGDLVGELAAIDRAPRSASVTALTPLRVMVFDSRAFLSVLDAMPGVRRRVLGILADRLRGADRAATA